MIMTSEQQQQIDHGNLSRFKTNTIIYIESAKKKSVVRKSVGMVGLDLKGTKKKMYGNWLRAALFWIAAVNCTSIK